MSSPDANAVIWINQQENDLPLIYTIPVSYFGAELPPLEDFVDAVTTQPLKEDDDDSTVQPTDDEEGDEGDEDEEKEDGKSDRKAAPKRAKLDPVAKAFRDHVTASEYMVKRLEELNIHALTHPWRQTWSKPARVVLSLGFEI